MRSKTWSRVFLMAATYPFLLIIAVIVLYPVVWMIYSSFKPSADIFASVFGLPKSLYLGNFAIVFLKAGMARYFLNSILVTAVSVAGLLGLCALEAYAFAIFRFRGKNALYVFVLLGFMVPPQALIISGYQLISTLHLLSSYPALILTYLSWSSFGVLVLRNFFESVPQSLLDAARIDGADHWQVFRKLLVPLSGPSMATIAIFYTMWIYNEFIYPLVYMQKQSMYTIPLGVLFLNSRYITNWGLQMAGLAAATIPPIIAYVIFQKQFVRGIMAGALKG
jgi:raffinose/stachyose/melibiose transport system permease protein